MGSVHREGHAELGGRPAQRGRQLPARAWPPPRGLGRRLLPCRVLLPAPPLLLSLLGIPAKRPWISASLLLRFRTISPCFTRRGSSASPGSLLQERYAQATCSASHCTP